LVKLSARAAASNTRSQFSGGRAAMGNSLVMHKFFLF